MIAIIAILASMLLPALKRAKDQAKSAACMNNLREMNMGFVLYRNDNNEWFPIMSNGEATQRQWPHRLNVYLKISADVLDSHSLKNPFVCPADPSSPEFAGTQRFWTWSDLVAHYTKNDILGRYLTDTNSFRQRNSVRSPSSTVMVLDGWGPGSSYGEVKWKDRHAGRVNLLFTDGHTESWLEEKVTSGPAAFYTPFWNPEY